MKVRTPPGSASAGLGPHGVITSWPPNAVIDVNDDDDEAVAFYRRLIDGGGFELVEDTKVAAEAKAASARSQPAAAEPAPRRGRPPLPRDAEGKVVRE